MITLVSWPESNSKGEGEGWTSDRVEFSQVKRGVSLFHIKSKMDRKGEDKKKIG